MYRDSIHNSDRKAVNVLIEQLSKLLFVSIVKS